MKKLIKISGIISLIFVITLSVIYFIYLILVPAVINSVKVNKHVEKLIFDKTGIELHTKKLKFKTNYNLKSYLNINEIYLENGSNKLLYADNLDIEFSPFLRHLNKINIDYIFIDKTEIDTIIKNNKEEKKSSVKFSLLPEIDIKKAEINIENDNKKTLIKINDIISKNEKENNITEFNASVDSTYLKKPIIINNRNNISFGDSSLKINELNIQMGESNLKLSGKSDKKGYEYKLCGNSLPVSDIETSILNMLKLKKAGKNFLENFYDFDGQADLDLKIDSMGIWGKCRMRGLRAKTEKFNIPIRFNDFTAYFDGQEINAEATGLLGPERFFTNFKLTDFNSEKKTIKGFVNSDLTNKITSEYIPNVKIDGTINASMSYYIHKKLPQITYLLKIKEGSNLYYKNASLDLTDKNRRLYVRTRKEGDKLYINSYDYSTQDGNNIDKILSGEGLITKKYGKLSPVFLTCRTNKEAPVSVTGSFGKKLEGGTFKGDLKYDFDVKLLTGEFELNDSKYKDFYVKEAKVTADKSLLKINANGTYLQSPFESQINMVNKFYDNITVNDIYLFLDNYTIKKEYKKRKPKKHSKIKESAEDIDFTVKNGRIKLNKVKKDKIIVEDIEITGNLKNDTVNFIMPHAYFAKGLLYAKGKYHIDSHSSDVEFSAKNIDSNSVANMIFNLPGQIEGIADAHLKAVTKNNLKYVKAKASFSVKGGFLPKLGSTQFIIKRSKKNEKPLKIRISDIINIDISQSKAMSSDLSGTFDITNEKLDNVEIFSKQKYLSLFIEGDYNIKKEDAKLIIWGNYNKNAQKKVKILFIPLSFIMKIIFKQENTKYLYMNKIKKIPPIQASEEETETFNVNIKGNLNNNNVKVQLKSLI